MIHLASLLTEVRACVVCAEHLPLGPRPVVQLHPSARILIAGQAPGRKVHEAGIPFDDASGDRLRLWLGMSRDVFYDPRQVAILPMGFCFPGTGESGDLPPRPGRNFSSPSLSVNTHRPIIFRPRARHSPRWFKRGVNFGLRPFPCLIQARATTFGSNAMRGSKRNSFLSSAGVFCRSSKMTVNSASGRARSCTSCTALNRVITFATGNDACYNLGRSTQRLRSFSRSTRNSRQ